MFMMSLLQQKSEYRAECVITEVQEVQSRLSIK